MCFNLLSWYVHFGEQVLPTVVKLFASSDRAIRVSLLQNIENFGAGLSTQIVDEQVRKTSKCQFDTISSASTFYSKLRSRMHRFYLLSG
jgi:hypothetical protein